MNINISDLKLKLENNLESCLNWQRRTWIYWTLFHFSGGIENLGPAKHSTEVDYRELDGIRIEWGDVGCGRRNTEKRINSENSDNEIAHVSKFQEKFKNSLLNSRCQDDDEIGQPAAKEEVKTRRNRENEESLVRRWMTWCWWADEAVPCWMDGWNVPFVSHSFKVRLRTSVSMGGGGTLVNLFSVIVTLWMAKKADDKREDCLTLNVAY